MMNLNYLIIVLALVVLVVLGAVTRVFQTKIIPDSPVNTELPKLNEKDTSTDVALENLEKADTNEKSEVEISPGQRENPHVLNLETADSQGESPLQKPLADASEVTHLDLEKCQSLIASSPFYVDKASQIVREETRLRNLNDLDNANKLLNISCFPHAIWLTGGLPEAVSNRIRSVITAAGTKIPVFVLYNVPDHNSATWHSGIGGKDNYSNWITAIAQALKDSKAWIILEPDSLGLAHRYQNQDKDFRLNQIKEAVKTLSSIAPNTRIYLDGGHSFWKDPEIHADLLKASGIQQARGFALNVSNFQPTETEAEYGNKLSELLGGKKFVIDTSRNGKGPDGHIWCNPRGRGLGPAPRLVNDSQLDAYLWVKPPGESDGFCNGGPAPGKFWLEAAIELVDNKN